jgi:cell wall-associated NlpC family hydrolase
VPGTATGQAIADGARKYLGVPYVWGGTDPAKGLDCSGLVQRVYRDLGIDVPRVAIDQGNAGRAVPNLAAAKPGDLLVMNAGQHIGIYMGNNQYIHAPAPGQSVRIETIPAGAVFDKIARIIPEASVGAAATTATAAVPDLLSTLQASLATGRAA